jgi:B12-binding domain/radical SAM domain protein of rhizo-twelve system
VKLALVNPRWRFEGSIYFGCREPHLPLEFGYARALLEAAGHEVELIDGQLSGLEDDEIARRVAAFAPERLIITTAPSYLFWRCAPPELRVPQETLRAIRAALPSTGAPRVIVVGPHASTTPKTTIQKLRADAAVLGECEDILPLLASPLESWSTLTSIARIDESGAVHVQGRPHETDMAALPALKWPAEIIARHAHHHHRFDRTPRRPGAEMEVSRGCPYHCTFCAKDNFRNDYRKREVATILEELDALIAQGVEYVYFIDEIFLPNRELLEALVDRPVEFGIQTRIDLWSPPMIDLLGRAGCVSIEAGVESITIEGRNLLDKGSRLSTDQIADRLIHARTRVPFVQANLIQSGADDPDDVRRWRDRLRESGVWANDPVPMFPYPGSPDYTRRWGAPDDHAWERAMSAYLGEFADFSDLQDARPLPLEELELSDAR